MRAHRLRSLKNRVLGKVFGSVREQATRGQKNDATQNCMMCSPTGIARLITSRNMRWLDVWHCGGEEKCMLCLVGKPEGKRSLGRRGRRWKKTLKWVQVVGMECHELDLSGCG
jgi:hypothetical protein